MKQINVSKLLVLIAVITFVLASLGSWPDVLHDFEPVALGLAFGFASFLVP